MRGCSRALWIAVGALVAAPALAADLPTKKPAPAPIQLRQPFPSKWQFEITGYGWASSVAGSTGFGTLPTLPYYASFAKVLEHFQGAFMGSVVARNDTFIAGVDLIWSQDRWLRNPPEPEQCALRRADNFTLNEGIVTAFGGVRAPHRHSEPRLLRHGRRTLLL